jgi:hypothetical protein
MGRAPHPLAALPSVDRLLQQRETEALIAGHGRPVGRLQDGAFILDLRCLEDEAGFLAQLGKL